MLLDKNKSTPKRTNPERSCWKMINQDGSYRIIYDDNVETIFFPKPKKINL